jgi:hypothetical protein
VVPLQFLALDRSRLLHEQLEPSAIAEQTAAADLTHATFRQRFDRRHAAPDYVQPDR